MGKENDLMEAARTGNVVTIGKLLSSGRGRNVLSQALSFRRALGPNCQDVSGYTPLHHAVLNSHRDAVQMLLRYDASPTVPDNRGSNPLHLAAWTGNKEIVQTLLTVGVSKDQVNEQNNYWDTPLHFAAQYGHTEVVSVLLENGADPTLCNRKEEGPLDLAAQYGRLETVQLLVRLRPDLLSKIPDSRSLLHLAAKNGHHKIVKLLLDAGCDINKRTKSGTALHEAAVFGKAEVVRVLLQHRPAVDVEITDSHSETALQKIESHSSKISQDISKMITAHIRGEPLPSPVEFSPSSQDGDMERDDPDGEDLQNIYDNVPEDRSRLHHLHHPELRGMNSTGGSRVHKPPRVQQLTGGDGNELYMNINQLPIKSTPPKKPQRNSIGILLDSDFNESPVAERKMDPEGIVGSSPMMHLDVRNPMTQYANTLSSQDSDSPPPLPDRNYYDLDQAGEYTQLRRDAVLPKAKKEKEVVQVHPEYDVMNEGLSNTSTDASDDTQGSLYEVLSHAQSGHPTPESPYPPYDIASRLPMPPAVQLHIHEPHDDPVMNRIRDVDYELDDEHDGDIDAYELLSEATTGGPSKGRPKPKPRITPTNSTSSIHNVPSSNSASSSKPVPLPRRNKPVPAKRSPGSISSHPSTPSEELTSSTASDQWGGPISLDRPPTPDQPPPSPHTAMMGIQAKLAASEAQYSDYDNPEDVTPCSCTNDIDNSVFFPQDHAGPKGGVNVHSKDCKHTDNVRQLADAGQLRKLELDLVNRSTKFHEFEAAADQLQTRLEKWQARVEETHLKRVNGQEDHDHDCENIYENLRESVDEGSSYESQKSPYDNHPVLLTPENANHEDHFQKQVRDAHPRLDNRVSSPKKPKRPLNAQLSLNASPPGYDNPSTCSLVTSAVSERTETCPDITVDTSPAGYDNPSTVTNRRFIYNSPLRENGRSPGQQRYGRSNAQKAVQKEEPSLDNKNSGSNSSLEILKPDASHPFAGNISSQFSGLIYGSNRGSRSMSLSQQDRLSLLQPSMERAHTFSGRLSGMRENGGTHQTDGNSPGKTDDPTMLDETSEWEQIESIMNSFGAGLVRESVYIRDFQQDFEKMFDGPIRPQSVGEWLDSLNLGQYENMLIANGFDHLDFIGGDIIEDQDLMDIGIVEEIHRKVILESTKCLPIMKPIGIGKEFTPKPASVSDWLRSLLLSDYIPNFLENNISTMDRALELWEFELENVLEIPMLGHRKRILASLGDRHRSRHSSTVDMEIGRPQSLEIPDSSDLVRPSRPDPPKDPPRATTESPRQELQIETFVGPEEREKMARHTSQSSSLDIDLFKDYSKEVTSPTRGSTSIPEEKSVPPSEEDELRTLLETTEQYALQNGDCANTNTNKEKGMTNVTEGQDSKAEAPQKASDPPGHQWMHPPDALIKGCCNYTSSYLGSSIIKELHGTESTREACTRLRRSALHLQKMPAITLSINYAGVKFIDSKSKLVITEHEICNISCVAQDSEDLKTFAYITKDNQYEKLYCHVFTVKTVELATEIILTLGQAFEIAYKMLLQKAREHEMVRRRSDENGKEEAPVFEDTKL